MVLVILIQVFYRYVLNNALPWPDELARFLMLWMTGLIAPSAFRWGGFVSIEMFPQLLPKLMGKLLNLCLLVLSLTILIIGFKLSLEHIKIGWIFESSSIKIPFQLIGGKTQALKLAWMYMSLSVGIFLLVLVNFELLLKQIISLFGPKITISKDPDEKELEA